MFKTKLKTAAKILGAVCAVLILCGFVYERIGRARDRKRLPQIGRSVDVGGRTLNIFCSGTGSPAAILDTGGDSPGLALEQTQIEIAKFTQACWSPCHASECPVQSLERIDMREGVQVIYVQG